MSKVWRSDGTPHREEGLKRWGAILGFARNSPPVVAPKLLVTIREPEEPDQPSRRPGLLPVEWAEGARRADFVPEYVSVGTMPAAASSGKVPVQKGTFAQRFQANVFSRG